MQLLAVLLAQLSQETVIIINEVLVEAAIIIRTQDIMAVLVMATMVIAIHAPTQQRPIVVLIMAEAAIITAGIIPVRVQV